MFTLLGNRHESFERVEPDKPADDSHVDDVCTHGRDPAVTEQDTLDDKNQREDEDCGKRRTEDDCGKRPADKVAAGAHRDREVEGLEGKDARCKHGYQRDLLLAHFISCPAEGEGDKHEGDEPVDCALRDGDECVGYVHGVTVRVTFFNYCSIG